MRRTLFLLAAAALLTFCSGGAMAADSATPFPVTIKVDAGKVIGPMTPIWRFFGADEPNYAYLKDGEKLIGELGDLTKTSGHQVYFRAHHLLTSGDGAYALKWGSTSAYKEDANGNPIYDWTINDRIFDTYLKHGVKPYVQLGFMPEALSTHPENYPHHPPVNEKAPADAGQSYPPKDYAKWGELAYQWTKHCVEKYGKAEVQSWDWEVWNEPNIMYWHGTPEDYFKLYDYAVAGVRRALPTAKVGGPETAGGPGRKFLGEFLNHCLHGKNYVTGQTGSPLDFVSFHAKGSPKFVDGHVRMAMSNQLKNMDDAFAVIASFPETKNLPIVIGESDPEGCAACQAPQNGYRNGTMYSSYTAASFPRALELARKRSVNLEGALTWAFEFENQPYFAGFRALATNGIDLPVLNVFRIFAKMNGQQLATESSDAQNAETILAHNVRETPDVSALASLDGRKLAVLVWHYHDDDVPGPDAAVNLTLEHLPFDGKATVTRYVIDADHSNSYAVWKKLGSPQSPTPAQSAELEKAGHLASAGAPEPLEIKGGGASVKIDLQRQAVELLVIEPAK